MKTKLFSLTIMCLLCFGFAQSQTKVSGTVTDGNEPLPAASVLIKDTKRGIITDFDGNFEITASENEILVITYLGYVTQEILIGKKTIFNIVLKEDASTLDEIIVVGYGVQKKKEVTGAVVSVKSDVLEQTATSDLGTALQGQIAGVNVVAASGEPGQESNIQIRGVSSVLGNNSPLYVVDGIPYENDPKLSINEIESIDVLKDGASAAIYGTRGASGVILITTKKAKEGEMKVKLDSYYGIQKITSGTPTLNASQKLFTTILKADNLNGTRFGNTWTIVEMSSHFLTNNTNLFNLIENDNAPIQNHNLSISGGKNGLSYNVNASYFSQEGVLIISNYDRFNLRSNTNYTKGNWDIRTGVSFRVEDNVISPWGLIRDAISYDPLRPELTLGTSELQNVGGDENDAQNVSYLGQKLSQQDNEETYYFDVNLNATYKFSDNLRFTTRAATSYTNGNRITIRPNFIAYREDGSAIQNSQSSVTNTSSLRKKLTWDGFLNYNKSIGKNNFNFTVAYSAEKYNYSQFLARKYDLFNNDITVLNNTLQDEAYAESGTNQWTSDRETTIIGSLIRLQYNYDGKYLINSFIRRDGSSRFSQQPYAVFPSVSLGWNVSQEDFWSSLKGTISQFKLRASRGTTGNNGAPDYGFSPTIQINRDYVFGTGANQNLQLGASQETFVEPNLKWETSISNNIGVDLAFMSNKLTVNADLYRTEKEDMLLPVLVPSSAGGASIDENVVRNVGNMVNKGVEIAVNYRHKGAFSWSTGLTFTKNTNEVTKMSSGNKILYFDGSTISGHDNDQDLVTVVTEGYEAGAFFLMKTDGLVNDDNIADYLLLDPSAKLGDLKYIDSTPDGKLTIDDRRYAGSGIPDFEAGYNFNANYKGFDLAMQWYGAFGGKIMNGNKALAYKSENHQDLIHQWTSFNVNSSVPANRGALHNNYRGHSDYWLEDGTYVRLRNISLGYTFQKKLIEKIGLGRLRIYVAGQNLLTFTKYTGYDPEVGGNGLSTRGIDKGNFPVSAQVRGGIQLEF